MKDALTWSVFELEKCSFLLYGSEFVQKLISAAASPAPTCIVWHQTLLERSVTSEPSVPPPLPQKNPKCSSQHTFPANS